MGGGQSKSQATIDRPLTKRPAHDTGKFLLQSLANEGTSTDGSGGLYLSLSEDGQLCGAKTENDPELWRLTYENLSSNAGKQPTQHDLLRLTNTGRKRVLSIDAVTSQLYSVSTDAINATPDQLFYLLQAGSKEGFYLIRSNTTLLFLSHSKDNVVSLSSDRNANDCCWKLSPSF